MIFFVIFVFGGGKGDGVIGLKGDGLDGSMFFFCGFRGEGGCICFIKRGW